MARATVTVEGLKQLSTALRACEPGVQRELTSTLRDAAQPAASAARAQAPTASGKLAASIGVRARRIGAAVGSRLVHAPILEFGRQAKVSGGKVRPHIRKLTPQKYLIGPVEASLPTVRARVTRGVQALLDRLIGRS